MYIETNNFYFIFSGVDIQLIEPGQVDTAMTEMFEQKASIPNASTFVQSAIIKLGFSARTCGYWAHSMSNWLIVQWLLPEWALAAVTLKVGKKQYQHAINMKKGD